MSGSDSSPAKADLDECALVEIAAHLYALRPDAFAAARDEAVRTARAEGKQSLARALSTLRRPTQSAWLVNLLWRDRRDALEELLTLADDLNRAQTQGSGPELLRLTGRRRELETTLVRRAGALARQAGVNFTTTMEREVEETLGAALASSEVADELRTGRLTKAATYAGFGPMPMAVPPREVSRDAAEDPKSSPPLTSRQPADDGESQETQHAQKANVEAERRAHEEQDLQEAAARVLADLREQEAQRTREKRKAAEQLVERARAAQDATASALADRRRAADALHQHHQEVRERAERLRMQLRDLERELTDAEHAARDAAQRRDEAEQEHEEAVRTLDQAEQDLRTT